jgi:hypothetical protein
MKNVIMTSLMLALSYMGIAQAECIQTPQSSWITQACYYTVTTDIYMNRKRYIFCGIPYTTFLDLVNAPSPGKYYYAMIKGKYNCW